MPANLPPQYFEAEKRFRAAKAVPEKIEALEEMLRLMPKHKGTDKLQADIKARIAKFRRQPQKGGARRRHGYSIPREGAGQIALAGPPNSGKSTLVRALTKAQPEAAAYPFTTREPTPGMMFFGDIAFQLIDLPPLSDDYMEPWLFDLIRRADLLWLVVAGDSPLSQLEKSERILAERKIVIYPAGSEPPELMETDRMAKPALLVVSGLDLPETAENLEILAELVEEPWPTVPVAAEAGLGVEELGRRTFKALGVIRVYTKQPGKPPDMNQPFTLEKGATVSDLASQIHNEIQAKMQRARVWGAGVFDGQTVQSDHVLDDGDVVEIII